MDFKALAEAARTCRRFYEDQPLGMHSGQVDAILETVLSLRNDEKDRKSVV